LKSIRVGPRSRVVNEEFADKLRIRTTLVDCLPDLVAPYVGELCRTGSTNSLCHLLSCRLFSCYLFCLLVDVGTLNATSVLCVSGVGTSHQTSSN